MQPITEVITDGGGERWAIANYSATFLLRSLDNPGRTVTVDSATLRTLGMEWNGREIQPVGGKR